MKKKYFHCTKQYDVGKVHDLFDDLRLLGVRTNTNYLGSV